MFKRTVYITVFLFSINWAFTQTPFSAYTLSGTVNIDSGEVRLIPVDDQEYYPNIKIIDETKIVKGIFCFRNQILYPSAYRLGVFSNSSLIYMSGLFFLDTGKQVITCNVDSIWKTPEIDNRLMSELKNEFNPVMNTESTRFGFIEKLQDSLNLVYNNKIPSEYLLKIKTLRNQLRISKHNALLNYVKVNSNSFVALWSFLQMSNDSYDTIYDTIIAGFSVDLQKTHTWKRLREIISINKSISPGCIFPASTLLDKDLKKVVVPNVADSKYTLIDFWFSNCNPCIAQFPELILLFREYYGRGFNITGISIDNKNNIPHWENVIKAYKLKWGQYLDLNGEFAKKINIHKYPTNFLVNNKGEILAKDIELWELKEFLEANFK